MNDSHSEYHLKTGEKVTVRLFNFGTAGFELLFQTDNDALVSLERLRPIAPVVDNFQIGSPVPIDYKITAISKGIVNITFYEKRAWETDEKRLIRKIIRINIM